MHGRFLKVRTASFEPARRLLQRTPTPKKIESAMPAGYLAILAEKEAAHEKMIGQVSAPPPHSIPAPASLLARVTAPTPQCHRPTHLHQAHPRPTNHRPAPPAPARICLCTPQCSRRRCASRAPDRPAHPHHRIDVCMCMCTHVPDCTHGHNPPQIKEAMATFDADGDGVTRQLAL